MYSTHVRAEARRRVAAGETTTAVAAALGVGQSTVWRWSNRLIASDTRPEPCWRCGPRSMDDVAPAYVYLLGQYLGDGHLVTSARVPVLRVCCCTDYPVILEQTRKAIQVIRGSPSGLVVRAQTKRMVVVQSYWMHWTCVFPQHGPGRKHERPIVLADWQRELVAGHPWALIRGLIHSDGCRALNRVVVRGRPYEYPRYFFANESRDILEIMGDALHSVGVAWRYNRPNSISVARREAVALMERHVGPKY